ncbi:MAG: hypothetical protein JXN64_09045 [Spirochaetes bacterium]|nr:hypothetical protein [Spirochaetota bacterium]
MITLKNINIEYLAAMGFGLTGLVLSLFAGFFSGNSISVILFRAFITAIILSIVGFICLFIIKKFVPEIYQIINSIFNNESADINVDSSNEKSYEKAEGDNLGNMSSDTAEFSEINENLAANRTDTDLESQFNTIDKIDSSSSLNADMTPGAVSHSGFKDNKIKYEPKIAAQAIRTMMKRDE